QRSDARAGRDIGEASGAISALPLVHYPANTTLPKGRFSIRWRRASAASSSLYARSTTGFTLPDVNSGRMVAQAAALIARDCANREKPLMLALPDQVRDIDRRRAPSRVSQRGQNATEGKRGERVTRQGTAHAVDDDIRSAASREASDAIGETLRREIDDIVEAEGTCLLGFGRVGRRRNRFRRALRAGQLGNGVTDRAADGRRQDGFAWLEARLRERNLRRQIGDRHAAGGCIIDGVRDDAQIFLAYSDPLAVGTVFGNTVRAGEHDPGAF